MSSTVRYAESIVSAFPITARSNRPTPARLSSSAALRIALRRRSPTARLVHHSDRGIPYASKDYTDLLTEHSIAISISRRGNSYDNAICESFMNTLKYEEVYRQEYRDLAEVLASIGCFIEKA